LLTLCRYRFPSGEMGAKMINVSASSDIEREFRSSILADINSLTKEVDELRSELASVVVDRRAFLIERSISKKETERKGLLKCELISYLPFSFTPFFKEKVEDEGDRYIVEASYEPGHAAAFQ
jgi:hypothetical protein